MNNDPHELSRFVDAQRDTYDQALAEMRTGAKRSHWMWYIFPQVSGLGTSPMARRFAIRSLAEAEVYLRHPVLGPRYAECVSALQNLDMAATANRVFGSIDAMKLRSSLTLFSCAGEIPMFRAAIHRWFGSPDELTIEILKKMPSSA